MALTTGLVSYWKLDGNSNDSVGSNNGSDTNVTYDNAYGKINQGALGNGSSTIINFGNSTSLKLNGNLSMSMWIYPTANSVGYVFGRTSNVSPYGMYYFYLGASGENFTIALSLFNSGGGQVIATSAAFPLNAWYHVVATVSGTAMTVYVNGVSSGTKTFSGTRSFTDHNNWAFCRGTDGVADYVGRLDEVGIWSRALTTDEITELYNAGAGLQYPFTTANTTNFFQFF